MQCPFSTVSKDEAAGPPQVKLHPWQTAVGSCLPLQLSWWPAGIAPLRLSHALHHLTHTEPRDHAAERLTATDDVTARWGHYSRCSDWGVKRDGRPTQTWVLWSGVAVMSFLSWTWHRAAFFKFPAKAGTLKPGAAESSWSGISSGSYGNNLPTQRNFHSWHWWILRRGKRASHCTTGAALHSSQSFILSCNSAGSPIRAPDPPGCLPRGLS